MLSCNSAQLFLFPLNLAIHKNKKAVNYPWQRKPNLKSQTETRPTLLTLENVFNK